MSTRLRLASLASFWRKKLHSLASPWRSRLYSSDTGSAGGRGVRLWRAFAFTAVVGSASYGVSAVRGEENRKRWMRRYWAYRKEKGLAAEVKRWWLGLSAASRFSLTIIALNGAVFAMWRIGRLSLFMDKFFVSSITQQFITRDAMQLSILLLPAFLAGDHIEWWHLGLNMMVLWSFAPVLLSILGDRLTAHNSWPFYLTSAAFASTVGLTVRKMRGVAVGSLGASGALLSVITLVVLNNPDATFYLIFLPFIPLPAPIVLMGVVGLDLCGLVRGWQLLDHAGHLGGVIFACLYQWGLGEAIRKGQAKVIRRWKKLKLNSSSRT